LGRARRPLMELLRAIAPRPRGTRWVLRPSARMPRGARLIAVVEVTPWIGQPKVIDCPKTPAAPESVASNGWPAVRLQPRVAIPRDVPGTSAADECQNQRNACKCRTHRQPSRAFPLEKEPLGALRVTHWRRKSSPDRPRSTERSPVPPPAGGTELLEPRTAVGGRNPARARSDRPLSSR
jgi:hypothetical protein